VTALDYDALPALHTPYELPPSAAAEFAANGHALLRGLASAAEVAAYRSGLEDAAARRTFEHRPINERDTYSAAFLQCVNLWRADEVARRFPDRQCCCRYIQRQPFTTWCRTHPTSTGRCPGNSA
jgi:hypothetical protein